MATIFHIALASEWARARAQGAYTTSTRGRSLAEVGFIHASRGDQWPAVRTRFYADTTEPLVLLRIDTDRLDVPVVDEPADDGSPETFPHIYGPLPVAAVVKAIPLGGATEPAPAPAPAPVTATTPTSSASGRRSGSPADFSRVFLTEMFFNVGVLCIALLCSVAGLALGHIGGSESGPGIGGVIGLVVGAWIAVRLYRRRRAAGAGADT